MESMQAGAYALTNQVSFSSLAILGRGIALAKETLAAADIAAGRLVRPFETRMPVGFAYYLVAPKSKLNLPKVSFFRDWILEEVRAEQSPS